MTNKQILAVLELGKNPLFTLTSISTHNTSKNVSIVSKVDSDPEQVKLLVAEIFPDASYNEADEWYQDSEGDWRKIHFSWVTGAHVSLHLLKKETPQQEGAQENHQTDYTSLEVAAQ